MIENFQDEIYQLENKQKVLNFVLTLETGGKKMPQNFLESTWKRICKIKLFKLYTDENKSKYLKDILKSANY